MTEVDIYCAPNQVFLDLEHRIALFTLVSKVILINHLLKSFLPLFLHLDFNSKGSNPQIVTQQLKLKSLLSSAGRATDL
jgi:hypothetical protein